jgi:hypothetical protein
MENKRPANSSIFWSRSWRDEFFSVRSPMIVVPARILPYFMEEAASRSWFSPILRHFGLRQIAMNPDALTRLDIMVWTLVRRPTDLRSKLKSPHACSRCEVVWVLPCRALRSVCRRANIASVRWIRRCARPDRTGPGESWELLEP